MTYLEAFFRIELVTLLVLILVLLIIGITKKEKILSETALSRLKMNWGTFKQIFTLALVAMVIFIAELAIEFIEAWRHVEFHSVYPLETQLIQVSLVTVLLVINILNLKLVLLLVGSGE